MDNPHDIVSKVKQVNERATLFRITSTAMINVSYMYTDKDGEVAMSHCLCVHVEGDCQVSLVLFA
jgi:hypothetical protein